MSMKKLTVCILILVTTLGIITSALGETTTPASNEFVYRNGVKLGMTIDEVRQIEGIEDNIKESNVLIYYNQRVGDETADLGYLFHGEKAVLTMICAQFNDSHTTLNSYIDDFSDIDKLLSKHYKQGDFTEDY